MSGQFGQIVGFAWNVAAIFFLVSWFLFPVSLAYWRAREKQRCSWTPRRRCNPSGSTTPTDSNRTRFR